ncbi:MAG: hypothetical protein MR550_03025 [Bacilli bacterium]|nr:hypothetical protein [Bacilli bacterium]
MKEKKRKKIFDLKSNDEKIQEILFNMKQNLKLYSKLITALQLLGTFDGKTEVELYDMVDNENESSIRLWCSDNLGNLFIFYGMSTNRNNLLKIVKETNEQEYEYDISLSKKFPLNEDNIDFTRYGNINDVKFGRLITNEKDFYSLFMGNDLGYQIQGDFNVSLTSSLITRINKLPSIPTLPDYIKIFEDVLLENDCKFSKMQILAFKEFVRNCNLNANNEVLKNNDNVLKKIK